MEALAYTHLGVCAMNLDDERSAKRYLERAVKVDPALASAHFNLGLLYLKQKDRLGAARSLHQAKATGLLEVDCDASLARMLRGSGLTSSGSITTVMAGLYAYHGMVSDAARCYGHAVTLSEPGALEGWILSMLRLGRADEVSSEIEHLLETSAHEIATHTLASVYFCARADFERALGHEDQAIALSGRQDPNAFSNKAETLLSAGRWREAEDTLASALELDPSHPPSHALLAQLRVREKDWSAALSHAETALAGDANGAHALEARAFSLHGLGRPAEAKVAFLTFLTIVQLLAPLEDNLEYRRSLATKMVAELESQSE